MRIVLFYFFAVSVCEEGLLDNMEAIIKVFLYVKVILVYRDGRAFEKNCLDRDFRWLTGRKRSVWAET